MKEKEGTNEFWLSVITRKFFILYTDSSTFYSEIIMKIKTEEEKETNIDKRLSFYSHMVWFDAVRFGLVGKFSHETWLLLILLLIAAN